MSNEPRVISIGFNKPIELPFAEPGDLVNVFQRSHFADDEVEIENKGNTLTISVERQGYIDVVVVPGSNVRFVRCGGRDD